MFVKNAVYVLDGTDIDLIVIDVRGKLALSKDIASTDSKVSIANKTIVLATGTDLDDTDSDDIMNLFTEGTVLAVSKLSNTRYVVVAADGSEYTFTVSVAPATAVTPAE